MDNKKILIKEDSIDIESFNFTINKCIPITTDFYYEENIGENLKIEENFITCMVLAENKIHKSDTTIRFFIYEIPINNYEQEKCPNKMNIDKKMLIIEKDNTSTLTINNHLYNFKLVDDFIIEIEIYLNLEREVNVVKDKKPVFGVVPMDGLEENEKDKNNNKRRCVYAL